MGDAGRAWGLLEAHRAAVRDAFDARLLALMERLPDGALSTLPAVAPHERRLWACVLARVQQRLRRRPRRRVLDPDAREPAGRLPRPRRHGARAPRPGGAPRAHAAPARRAARVAHDARPRVLLAVSGRLEPVPCPARRVAALDAAWLTRYPAVAAALQREMHRVGCPLRDGAGVVRDGVTGAGGLRGG